MALAGLTASIPSLALSSELRAPDVHREVCAHWPNFIDACRHSFDFWRQPLTATLAASHIPTFARGIPQKLNALGSVPQDPAAAEAERKRHAPRTPVVGICREAARAPTHVPKPVRSGLFREQSAQNLKNASRPASGCGYCLVLRTRRHQKGDCHNVDPVAYATE